MSHFNSPAIDLEAERVKCVFGLGGGELHEPNEKFPDEWDGVIAYWYEGAPEYATELRNIGEVKCPVCKGTGNDPDADDADCIACEGRRFFDLEVRTAILAGTYGLPAPPPGWEQIAEFSASGEADCCWCGAGTGNEDERDDCELCEGDGLIYLGEGMAEVVYRRTPSSVLRGA